MDNMEIPTPTPTHHPAGYILAAITYALFIIAHVFQSFAGWFISPGVSIGLQNCSYMASVVIAIVAFYKLFFSKRKKPKE